MGLCWYPAPHALPGCQDRAVETLQGEFLDLGRAIDLDKPLQGRIVLVLGANGKNEIPVGIGALLACGIFFHYDSIIVRAQAMHKPWSQTMENRLPLACLGGPILVVSLFWLVRLQLHIVSHISTNLP